MEGSCSSQEVQFDSSEDVIDRDVQVNTSETIDLTQELDDDEDETGLNHSSQGVLDSPSVLTNQQLIRQSASGIGTWTDMLKIISWPGIQQILYDLEHRVARLTEFGESGDN